MICEYLCAAGSILWLIVEIFAKTGQKKGEIPSKSGQKVVRKFGKSVRIHL